MIKKNILSISVTILIIYLSLAPSDNFDKVPINIPNFDKFVHFMMYLTLTSVIIFENRKSIGGMRQILILALFPLLLGITMEILQVILGEGRTGSIYDVFANVSGIVVSLLLWFLDRKRSKPLIR